MLKNLYSRVFACLLSRGDPHQHELYGDRKRSLFSDIEGTVLEIGPGSGVNLRYFPDGIRWIGIEPNVHMHPYIQEKAQERAIEVDLRDTSADDLDIADESVDAVVSTLVLCSVPDPGAALSEIRRVLKPGGRFYVIEHVAAPRGTWLRKLQHGIKPLWRLAADGCRPDRETGRILEAAGFSDVNYDHFDAPISLLRPHIMGVATR